MSDVEVTAKCDYLKEIIKCRNLLLHCRLYERSVELDCQILHTILFSRMRRCCCFCTCVQSLLSFSLSVETASFSRPGWGFFNSSVKMSLLKPTINNHVQPPARSGHTAVKHEGWIIVHGGYNEKFSTESRPRDMYMPSNEIWTYNIEASTWKMVKTSGSYPMGGVSGATSCVLNDCMVVFGGYGSVFGRTSDVFELDLRTLIWRNLTKEGLVKGPCPSERDKLVNWVHKNQIIVFGGYGPRPGVKNRSNGDFCFDESEGLIGLGVGWNNDACVLDFAHPEGISWRYPETGEERPVPRAAHAATKIRNKGYVFGGRYRGKRLNDMFYLDLDKFTWHKVNYNTSAPKGRSWHVFEEVSESSIFLHGGMDTGGNIMSDMWLFNTKTREWVEIVSTVTTKSQTRIWHTSAKSNDNDEVIMFGGCENSVLSREPNKHSNTVLRFRASPLKLEEICAKQLEHVMNSFPYNCMGLKSLPKHLQSRLSAKLTKKPPGNGMTTTCHLICSLL